MLIEGDVYMPTVVAFINEHAEEVVNYWISTYYVNSDEYQLRRHDPSYVEAHRHETIALLKQALMNESSIASNAKNIGEDRLDMRTSFKDALTNHMSFYRAINEFLIIHYKKRTLICTEEEIFDMLLKFREYEATSLGELFAGYTSKEVIR